MGIRNSDEQERVRAAGSVVLRYMRGGEDGRGNRLGEEFGVSLCVCSGNDGSSIRCHSTAGEEGHIEKDVRRGKEGRRAIFNRVDNRGGTL